MIAFTIPLSAAWRFQQSSEDSAVAKPGFDDSTWKLASLDELPSLVLGEPTWIRKRFRFGCQRGLSALSSLLHTYSAVDVFVSARAIDR